MRKRKPKKENKFIAINLAIYRMFVVVTWEPEVHKIANWANKNGTLKVTDEWITTFLKSKEKAIGCCLEFGKDNTDVLIWLKERPKKASQYGTLYHELYHAVDHITDTHNLSVEREARAYVYEYLIDECNRVLWT